MLQDNIFQSLQGEQASAIYIYDTHTVIIASVHEDAEEVHFLNNVASAGSTIVGVQAVIYLKDITMKNNFGVQGACASMTYTELKIVESRFEGNAAMQGGVIFAIQKTFVESIHSSFSNNFAEDGAVLYSMSNKNTDRTRVNVLIAI